MYDNKKDNKNRNAARSQKEERVELNLEKAIKAISQQANGYRHAGLTHISSLLD